MKHSKNPSVANWNLIFNRKKHQSCNKTEKTCSRRLEQAELNSDTSGWLELCYKQLMKNEKTEKYTNRKKDKLKKEIKDKEIQGLASADLSIPLEIREDFEPISILNWAQIALRSIPDRLEVDPASQPWISKMRKIYENWQIEQS